MCPACEECYRLPVCGVADFHRSGDRCRWFWALPIDDCRLPIGEDEEKSNQKGKER
jgi:hypothetical protein